MSGLTTSDLENTKEFLFEKHIEYIAKHGREKNENADSAEGFMTEFLRMSGIYWGVTALDLLNALDQLDRNAIIKFVKSCQCPVTGGFSPAHGHDPHILYTLSAIQILCIYNCLDKIDTSAVAEYIAGLQQPDGSFSGDKWGEIDTRFSFAAVGVLTLIGRLDVINTPKAVDFVISCANPDGGFGSKPKAESHAGLIYCCVGFLSIVHALDRLDVEKLAWWLCERQVPTGGLNGRPEKLPDVCYSWWVLATLKILDRAHWICGEKLEEFMLTCQDEETGGFGDRCEHLPDVFHTLFGIGALSMLGGENGKRLKTINPSYCLPDYVLERLNIRPQML